MKLTIVTFILIVGIILIFFVMGSKDNITTIHKGKISQDSFIVIPEGSIVEFKISGDQIPPRPFGIWIKTFESSRMNLGL